MSLNRSEQQICDYVETHPEELRYWQDKVKAIAAAERDRHRAAFEVAEVLVAYTAERAAVVPALGELASEAVSMRNLSEYWLRLWAPPPPKKKRV